MASREGVSRVGLTGLDNRDAMLNNRSSAKKATSQRATKPDPAATPMAIRRPQAQRSAETQAKLIAAAIACLHRVGYSATTVTMVASSISNNAT